MAFGGFGSLFNSTVLSENAGFLQAALGRDPFGDGTLLLVISVVFIVIVLAMIVKQLKLRTLMAQNINGEDVEEYVKHLSSSAADVDRSWFVLFVTNMCLTVYFCGAFPNYYYLFYTPKIIVLIFVRLVNFYHKKQHFLLWDFCYWANFLCIYFCWFDTSPKLFRIVFMCANGPLAFSILVFGHSMVFHSYAHSTSVVVHTSPLILTYGLRWYASPVHHGPGADHFRVCDTDADSCMGVSVFSMVTESLLFFYLWWAIVYYILVFVVMGSYIEQMGYQTLWDRMLIMKPVGPMLKAMLDKYPKLLVQFTYLIMHLIFTVVTFLLAARMWHSHILHAMFLALVVLAVINNSSNFYFEVFAGYYHEAASARAAMQPSRPLTLAKQHISAFGSIDDIMQVARDLAQDAGRVVENDKLLPHGAARA